MTTLGLDAARSLRGAFHGDVLLPESPGYDEARIIFNGAIDKRPGLIAQCAGPDDVALAIGSAREMGLEIAVRCGGHGVAGKALTDDGVVVDLRRMKQVEVDPAARTARVGGGATISDLDNATQRRGLATTGGRASTTGSGGFTLNGGSGWLERKFGLACDNLLGVELVTADGRRVHASADENPELFWALHGGGGNFGVATEFTFRLYELPVFSMALLLWPAEAGRDVLAAYRRFIETAPDEVGGGFLFMTGPPEEFIPDHLVGRRAIAALVTYAGPEQECRELAEPLLGFAPDGALIAEVPYVDFQCMLDDPPGLRNYWSAEYLTGFPDEAVDAFCRRAADMIVPSPSMQAALPQGGALGRGNDVYPVPWRAAPWAVHPFALWESPVDDERAAAWARGVCDEVGPWALGSVYLNFIGDEGHDRVVDAFGADNYRRLAAIKAEYDPENVFHLNHNIRPA
ncbi:MAG: FAD-binding oxidoreductase [Streptomycetaceae bacterium]|nr:FAD-binding oxidoreductase [Streptomycetaceae bacterium]